MMGNVKIKKITKTFLGMAMVLVFAFSIAQISMVSADTVGPNYAAAGSSTGIGTNWGDTSTINSNNDDYAYANLNHGDTSRYLKGSGFGFAIPAGATIGEIIVTMGRASSTGITGGDRIRDLPVRISTDGTNLVGDNKALTGTNWPTSEGAATYGGAADTWGTTLTPAQINSSKFSVFLSFRNANSNYDRTAYVDYIRITVTYRVVNYTITFDSAGGSPVSSISQLPGTAVTAPAATSTPTTVPTAVPTTGVLGAAKTGEAGNMNTIAHQKLTVDFEGPPVGGPFLLRMLWKD